MMFQQVCVRYRVICFCAHVHSLLLHVCARYVSASTCVVCLCIHVSAWLSGAPPAGARLVALTLHCCRPRCAELTAPKSVYSFVEVQLQHRSQPDVIERGKCYEGKHPDWNSEITLLFKPKTENGTFTLAEIRDPNNKLFISLFDNLQKKQDDAVQRNKYQITIENYYLGSVMIPLNQVSDWFLPAAGGGGERPPHTSFQHLHVFHFKAASPTTNHSQPRLKL